MKTKTLKLKGKFTLEYVGSQMFVYGEPKTVWTLERVDGFRAGTPSGFAVGVNDDYILFKNESNRKFDKTVFWSTINKKTGEDKLHSDRPKDLGRFSKIKTDFS